MILRFFNKPINGVDNLLKRQNYPQMILNEEIGIGFLDFRNLTFKKTNELLVKF